MDNVTVTKDLNTNTLTIERTFDAPREKAWQAYADKKQFEKWWGPEGWETTVKEFDFAPGGTIHYGMKCVDKNQAEWYLKESWGLMRIESVNKPHEFSAKDYFSDDTGEIDTTMPGQRFVVELVETDSQTRLINRSITDTPEQLERLVQMGMVEGFASQLNKLEWLLAE